MFYRIILILNLILCNAYAESTLSRWADLESFIGHPEVIKFSRCYHLFTRSIINYENKYFKKILRGELTANKACSLLLKMAQLNNEGVLEVNNEESRKILKTFNDLHFSWFTNLNFDKKSNLGIDYFYDIQEPALYYTRSLFQVGKNAQDILKGNTTIMGKRDIGKYSKEFFYIPSITANIDPSKCNTDLTGENNYFCSEYNSESPQPFIYNQLDNNAQTEVGSLYGITTSNLVVPAGSNLYTDGLLNSHWFKYGDFTVSFDINGYRIASTCPNPETGELVSLLHCFDRMETKYPVDLKKTLGGGLIGSFAYQYLNASNTKGEYDGYFKVNRRWSSNVFQDVLCRDLPLLTEEDAVSFSGEIDYTSNHPGFRYSPFCQKCHLSVDFAARSNRNFAASDISMHYKELIIENDEYIDWYNILMPYQYNTLEHLDPNDLSVSEYINEWNQPIEKYVRTTPQGQLNMRSFLDNSLIRVNVGGVQSFADALLTTPDFYGCISKRYLNYLTGIDVSLKYFSRNEVARMNSTDRKIMDFHRKLTTELKRHKDVKKTINSIIESEYFMGE